MLCKKFEKFGLKDRGTFQSILSENELRRLSAANSEALLHNFAPTHFQNPKC